MIKMAGRARRHKDGRQVKLVVLGLSHMNLERLKQGESIMFDGEEVKLPNVNIVIFSGATEATMQKEVIELLGGSFE